MLIVHLKESTAPDDGNPDHIQGDDWNQPHVLGHSSLIPFAMAIAKYDAATDTLSVLNDTYRINSVTLGAGFMAAISVSGIDALPVPTGADVNIIATVSVNGAQPSGHVATTTVYQNEGLVELHIYNGEDEVARFQNTCLITVVIYAEVLLLF